MTSPQQNQTLGYWLGLVMRSARGDDVLIRHVAEVLDTDVSTISRFESGKGKALPGALDEYLAAYAALLDVEDPRVFYDDALRLWHAQGDPPQLSPTRQAVAAARRATLRPRKPGYGRRPSASPRKRRAE